MPELKEWPDIAVSTQGHVAIVEIQRPPNNFFDIALIIQLAEALEWADATRDVRAVVLAAQGKAFCAGADFSGDGEGGPAALYREAVRLFSTLKPIVAAVQGPAIGGGLGLCLAADFRIAAPEARFAANFVKIGIHPGFGLTHTLPRLIGVQAASNLFYTGRRVDGAGAVALGLADELVSLPDLRARAIGFADELAENAPLAVQATRQTLRANLAAAVKTQSDREQEEQGRLFKTADFREGVRSVQERRPGHWTGA
jgi:enoyl-CoA hydratase/carnithine racemase